MDRGLKTLGTAMLSQHTMSLSVVQGESKWSDLLSRKVSAGPPVGHLIILGDRDTGRRSLVNSLLEVAGLAGWEAWEANLLAESYGVGMVDFAYFKVVSPDGEQGKVHVHLLNVTDDASIELLKQDIGPESLQHAAIIICLSLEEAPQLRQKLRAFLEAAGRVSHGLCENAPLAEQDALRSQLEAYVSQESTMNQNKEHGLLLNLGLPVVVVVTKSDLCAYLDSQQTLGQAAIVAAFLRRLCLPYGAALIYTSSVSPNTNSVTLYQYLLHRLYGWALEYEADEEAKDALFIPSGYDSQEKLDIVVGNTSAKTFDAAYENLVNATVHSGSSSHRVEVLDQSEVVTLKEELMKLAEQFPKSRMTRTKKDPSKSGPESNAAKDENLRGFFENLVSGRGAQSGRKTKRAVLPTS